MAEDVQLERPRTSVYPEWDEHHRRYRPDWCSVIETPPESAESTDATPLALPDLHNLRRALASLGVELERRHRQAQGDDLDIDAAVQCQVDVIAGSAVDEAVYVDTVRGRRDLAVLVLLDISGSAGEPGVTGMPVHHHQRIAAAALTATLYELGVRVALYAFRSMGRSAVTVFPVKRFEETFGLPVLTRLGGLTPGAYTRLGAAIRHGAAVLQRDGGVGRKLLVTLSDGFAYDHGYEGRYGEADARRALAESRRQGVGCLCLSIGATTETDALQRVFGTAAHARLPRAEDLVGTAKPLFHSALRSAEAQRRAWLRKHPGVLAHERRTA
jgi:nitric oxide reductase activation protein